MARCGSAGPGVQVRDAYDVTTVHRYDAVIVGSAIYNTRWRSYAVRVVGLIVDKSEDVGSSRTWLFHTDFATSDLPAPHPSIVHTPTVFPGGTTVRTG